MRPAKHAHTMGSACSCTFNAKFPTEEKRNASASTRSGGLPVDRRSVLTGTVSTAAVALLAAGLPAQVAAHASVRPSALIMLAAFQFKGGPSGLLEGLGTLEDWQERAAQDHYLAQLAAATMGRNDIETADYVEKLGIEISRDLATAFGEMRDRFQAFGELMAAAQLRTLAGMSRQLMRSTSPAEAVS